jgi:DNA-binding winged helix-turn-helix (wHTH) protein
MQPQTTGRGASRGAFRLGEWLVEPTLNRLTRGDTTVQLELKLMEVLLFLAERQGEVASKAEIIDAVWQTEFIAENTLTHSIADLRRTLGDDARSPRFIETIPKRGYRIVAPVSGLEPALPVEPAASQGLRVVLPDREVYLREGANIVGRSESAEIHVDSSWASRRHARITVAEGRAVIEDLGSKNGTFVQGERLTACTELRPGDEIHIGRRQVVLRFLVDGGTTLTEATGELGADGRLP